ncbi:inositol monophosphatase family protein [Eisenibacter elegans]|jgi:myo-inositol-1(or 4)-monophosphatase|uniref:inositol monophosphatase family protein n=1 Tax=Eisenibacter elegans TaxID=997 RepID=UPI00047CCA93|nr:inositol monophosphatase family protein [Eisenibacter elegans]
MNLTQLSREVAAAAREVGQFIRQESKNFSQDKVEYKGTNDLVSYVDKEAEKQVLKALHQALPEAGVVSEEDPESHKLSQTKYHWIIDPLDGTTNFIHGVPIYSVSIALLEGETPILGVVYEVNQDECFSATKGGGAFLNERPIQTSSIAKAKQALLATGFPYTDFERMDEYIAVLRHLMQHTHGLRRMGSAAVDLAYVAAGRFDAFFEYNLNAWDVAAGALIVQEAGGEVSTFNGGQNFIFGREIVATNGHLMPHLLPLIQQFWV